MAYRPEDLLRQAQQRARNANTRDLALRYPLATSPIPSPNSGDSASPPAVEDSQLSRIIDALGVGTKEGLIDPIANAYQRGGLGGSAGATLRTAIQPYGTFAKTAYQTGGNFFDELLGRQPQSTYTPNGPPALGAANPTRPPSSIARSTDFPRIDLSQYQQPQAPTPASPQRQSASPGFANQTPKQTYYSTALAPEGQGDFITSYRAPEGTATFAGARLGGGLSGYSTDALAKAALAKQYGGVENLRYDAYGNISNVTDQLRGQLNTLQNQKQIESQNAYLNDLRRGVGQFAGVGPQTRARMLDAALSQQQGALANTGERQVQALQQPLQLQQLQAQAQQGQISNQQAALQLQQAQQLHQLYQQLQAATDPKERQRLTQLVLAFQGKNPEAEKYLLAKLQSGTDAFGQPTYEQVPFSTTSGEFVYPRDGNPPALGQPTPSMSLGDFKKMVQSDPRLRGATDQQIEEYYNRKMHGG